MRRKIKKKYKDSGYLIPLYSENKRGFEMSFNWIFAMVAGGFILFLAIYAASQLISVGSVTANTFNSKNFVSIIDTYGAGFASGSKSPPLNFALDTRMSFSCYSHAEFPFGKETVSISDKNFGDKYSEEGLPVIIKNKYLFTESQLEGKTFYTFSFGFFMPFKIADLIMLSDRNYTFYNAPSSVKKDVDLLGINNVILVNASPVECDCVRVCFDRKGNCDVEVSTAGEYVIKDGQRMYYKGNLLYAAIFSSPDIYECNLQRLMNEFSELGGVYANKIKIIERMKCISNVGDKLSVMTQAAGNFTMSSDLRKLYSLSDEIDSINNAADPECKLYKNEEKD